MAIITTYPFKKAPLNKEDEIIISDFLSNPKLKTKTTNLKAVSRHKIKKCTTIKVISSIMKLYQF